MQMTDCLKSRVEILKFAIKCKADFFLANPFNNILNSQVFSINLIPSKR